MPSYLDFNSTKNFRNFILGKTLASQDGPQNMSESSYSYQNQSDYSNVDPGAVDSERQKNLEDGLYSNTYKPNNTQVFIYEELNDFSRRANLNFYSDSSGNPYFVPENHNLIGIMSNANYQTESELFKFAANWIRDPNERGPVFSRIQQNLEAATIGRVRLIDALNGNTATAINIVTGREPLVEKNYKITVASTVAGKAIDFLQTVAGVEFPFSEIPGDYLSNPRNPVNTRPEAQTLGGQLLQDVTGALGSIVGIQRRPKLSSKPSDIMVEYMGQGQRQVLYDLLSYSKYAPNYTTSARSQQSSKIFAFADNVSNSVNRLLGLEAPRGLAYVGDDRGNDVKYATNDFNDRPIKSSFYLSLLFDPVQTLLFHREKNTNEAGPISGPLTWVSNNSRNRLGENNKEYNTQRSQLEDSLSVKYGFRRDSILGYTQEILNTMPTNGGESRAHVANVIDQTSRIFREGEKLLSRGSAIKYVDKFGQESGVEYCRVWTKDRPYFSHSDTMKIGGNIRKYDGSVMTNPWNLNIAPMSNGKKGFDGSSNIFPGYEFGADGDGKSFYAKKYMFSIENLAWKTSNTPGFTVLDLPYCERGPSGGRIMWFPPYGLTVNESNSANWESTTFLGRPEPIYTYQHTSRTGQINFKIVVDHPSILNLLVREHFKDMSDEEADNYINAVFAGCEQLDFYALIRRYTTLDVTDIKLIQDYLNDKENVTEIKRYRTVFDPIVQPNPGAKDDNGKTNSDSGPKTITFDTRLHFEHAVPTKTGKVTEAGADYGNLFNKYSSLQTDYVSNLDSYVNELLSLGPKVAKADYDNLFGPNTIPAGTNSEIVNAQKSKLTSYFVNASSGYTNYAATLNELKNGISGNTVQSITLDLSSSTSSIGKGPNNRLLSLRRSHSVIQDVLKKISKDGQSVGFNWITEDKLSDDVTQVANVQIKIKLKELGYDNNEGELVINSKNYGEQKSNSGENAVDTSCSKRDFKNVKPLDIYSPISFFCRHVEVKLKYQVQSQKPEEPIEEDTVTLIPRLEEETTTLRTPPRKPRIDVMKRIVMKTLSECFYFKKLEEDSPVAFSSLKEKLRYFHPAFHSTTPEGLNSRMTFLQQCLRPGDTIPVKGLSDDSDINARNTTFGPPPICVLRIGDFYHSKVVIKDVNFTFDDSTWDLNPEGIGVQPMIVNVSLQLNFIGGQGLEKPIERLQNALSSNFYANTEIYDERAKPTATTIAGQDAKEFTKSFLESLITVNAAPGPSNATNVGNELDKEKYIGNLNVSENTINYTDMVNTLRTNVENYFSSYPSMYNKVNKDYGPEILNVIVSPTYRTIKTYDVYSTVSPTPSTTIDIFGLYKKNRDLTYYIKGLKTSMVATLESSNPSELLGFNKELTTNKITVSNELLTPYLTKLIETKLDALIELDAIKTFEIVRDKLITSIDGLNYVVKYGKDAKLQSTDKAVEVTLSGFTSGDLYEKYEDVINHISDNNTMLYEDVDATIDFNSITITDEILTNILKVFLQGETEKIITLYKDRDQTLFDEKVREKLTKRLNNFIVTPDDKKFKPKKLKAKKDDNELVYKISSQADITDNDKLVELRKLKINKLDVQLIGKLNYYKK